MVHVFIEFALVKKLEPVKKLEGSEDRILLFVTVDRACRVVVYPRVMVYTFSIAFLAQTMTRAGPQFASRKFKTPSYVYINFFKSLVGFARLFFGSCHRCQQVL